MAIEAVIFITKRCSYQMQQSVTTLLINNNPDSNSYGCNSDVGEGLIEPGGRGKRGISQESLRNHKGIKSNLP